MSRKGGGADGDVGVVVIAVVESVWGWEICTFGRWVNRLVSAKKYVSENAVVMIPFYFVGFVHVDDNFVPHDIVRKPRFQLTSTFFDFLCSSLSRQSPVVAVDDRFP